MYSKAGHCVLIVNHYHYSSDLPPPKTVKDSQVGVSHVLTQRPKDPKAYELWLSVMRTPTSPPTQSTQTRQMCPQTQTFSYFQIIPHALVKHTICVPTQAT